MGHDGGRGRRGGIWPVARKPHEEASDRCEEPIRGRVSSDREGIHCSLCFVRLGFYMNPQNNRRATDGRRK